MARCRTAQEIAAQCPAAATGGAESELTTAMDPASEELEWRSRYLSSLIQRTKLKPEGDQPPEPTKGEAGKHEKEKPKLEKDKPKPEKEKPKEQEIPKRMDGEDSCVDPEEEKQSKVRVRAADMPPALQRRAFRCARAEIAAMKKLDSKRLALALKKEFDSLYGPAWHCIVGTSFGSYVTHSLGGFLYFSVDKVYVLLFRTAVETLDHR